jgi:hypothetical protein
MKKVTTKSYALRIGALLVKPLQELKKRNRRSLNAEINAALEGWIAQAHPAAPAATEATSADPAAGVTPHVGKDAPKRARKQPKKRAAVAVDDASAT